MFQQLGLWERARDVLEGKEKKHSKKGKVGIACLPLDEKWSGVTAYFFTNLVLLMYRVGE